MIRTGRVEPGHVRDEGSGTVLAVGLVGAVALLMLALVALGQAVVCRQRAEAAADLAALAAASVAGGSSAARCGRAAEVAAANRAALSACSPAAADGSVTVGVAVDLPLWLSRLLPGSVARASARAGSPFLAGPTSAAPASAGTAAAHAATQEDAPKIGTIR